MDLKFKIQQSNKCDGVRTDDLSPITQKKINARMQDQYDKKFSKILHNSNLTFENIETPGWSSLVQSQITDNRKHNFNHQEIMKKLSMSNNHQIENNPKHKSVLLEYKEKLKDNNVLKERKSTYENQNHSRMKTAETHNNAKKQNEKTESRFNQITVYEHLYLDSKKLQTKRTLQKIIDEQYKNQIMKFHPTINRKSIKLAEQRYKKIQNNMLPKKQNKPKQKPQQKQKPKVDNNEVQFKCLHSLFYIITNSTLILNRQNLNIEQVPLPCIRSLEPILEQIYTGKEYKWVQFLEIFYNSIQYKKSFFKILSEWMRRKDIDLDI